MKNLFLLIIIIFSLLAALKMMKEIQKLKVVHSFSIFLLDVS